MMMLTEYATLGVACVVASAFIIRDLLKRKHSHRSVPSIAGLLTSAAGIITVIALIMGLGKSSDPRSMFSSFYVFVFYCSCAIWALQSRISAAELAAREQSLRIQYRLAELAERLKK
jgi:hypothetical protein